MTEGEYEKRTNRAYRSAWAEFECEYWDPGARVHRELAAYYVDDELVLAITDVNRQEYKTCYHEHFDRAHGHDPGPTASVGQRRLRYTKHLEQDVQGRKILKLKWIRRV
jgi:hypothetical protein